MLRFSVLYICPQDLRLISALIRRACRPLEVPSVSRPPREAACSQARTRASRARAAHRAAHRPRTPPGAMDTAMDMYYTLRDMRKRQLAHQVLNLAMIVCSALMIWKSLMVITESDSPVVVVLRCSHRPLPARTPDPWRCDPHAVHSDPRRGSLTVGAWSRPSTEATSYSCTWASHPSVPATSWSSRWPIVRFRSCTASSRCASCTGLVHRLVHSPRQPEQQAATLHPGPSKPAPAAPRQVHEKESGAVDILTKGDNNQVDDRGLYAGAPRVPA